MALMFLCCSLDYRLVCAVEIFKTLVSYTSPFYVTGRREGKGVDEEGGGGREGREREREREILCTPGANSSRH